MKTRILWYVHLHCCSEEVLNSYVMEQKCWLSQWDRAEFPYVSISKFALRTKKTVLMLDCHTTPFTLSLHSHYWNCYCITVIVTLLLNDTENLKSLLYCVACVDPGKYRKDLFQVSVVMTYTVHGYATGADWLLFAVVLNRHVCKGPCAPTCKSFCTVFAFSLPALSKEQQLSCAST